MLVPLTLGRGVSRARRYAPRPSLCRCGLTKAGCAFPVLQSPVLRFLGVASRSLANLHNKMRGPLRVLWACALLGLVTLATSRTVEMERANLWRYFDSARGGDVPQGGSVEKLPCPPENARSSPFLCRRC